MCWGEQFTYDEWANLTTIGSSGSAYTGCAQDNLNITMSTTGNNQISASSGVSYDASGNVTADGVNTYAWNAESEQKTGNGVNYVYDGDGNRLYKATGSTPNKIYWYGAGTEILDESDGSGNITNEYVFFGGRRMAMDTISGTGGGSIGTTYYYAEDFLGSSRTMVQAGQTSACFDADFLPFGREKDAVTTCAVNNYKFEGKERDAETGNDDFGARYYSSNFGRWLSPDWSSTPEAVPYANLTNPQTLNLYAMVEDDPESFADLDGHQSAQSDPNVHAGQTGCNLDTGNGCPELALLVIGGNGMAHSLGVGEVLQEIGELIALQDHGQFTIADLGISDPAQAKQHYGRQPDGSYRADTGPGSEIYKRIHGQMANNPIGNGQCVTACWHFSGVPRSTGTWTPGRSVLKLNDTTDVGLAIASFGPNGKFAQTDLDQNSAIYMGHDKNGRIMVVDQWPPPNPPQTNAPFLHPLVNYGLNDTTQRMENNAAFYHVIIVP